jgi:hypothetical protein
MDGFLHGPRPQSRPTPTAPGPEDRAAVTPFKPRVTSPWSRYALRAAPTRTPLKWPHLTTWSRPHSPSLPTLGPALTRTNTVTCPQPGPAPRHLPDSDAPDLYGSPRPAGPPGSGPTRPAHHSLHGPALIGGEHPPFVIVPDKAPSRYSDLHRSTTWTPHLPLCEAHARQAPLCSHLGPLLGAPSQRVSGQPPPARAVCIPHSTNAVCT